MASLATIEERRSEKQEGQAATESLSSFPAPHGERHQRQRSCHALEPKPGFCPTYFSPRAWGSGHRLQVYDPSHTRVRVGASPPEAE
jgi:hypothetical protein